MLRLIVICGAVAGLVVTAPMFASLLTGRLITDSLLVGYLVMILALSLVFVAVKHHRDRVQGGVIRFWPALTIGLGVSAVASVFYVIGWEITLAATRFAFIDSYGAAMVEAARSKGGSPAQIARAVAQAETFRVQYANPLYRLPMTFAEIFPVGVVVSLIAAALLRNSRFLPARAPVST